MKYKQKYFSECPILIDMPKYQSCILGFVIFVVHMLYYSDRADFDKCGLATIVLLHQFY